MNEKTFFLWFIFSQIIWKKNDSQKNDKRMTKEWPKEWQKNTKRNGIILWCFERTFAMTLKNANIFSQIIWKKEWFTKEWQKNDKRNGWILLMFWENFCNDFLRYQYFLSNNLEKENGNIK
jgi:hypothetical protein